MKLTLIDKKQELPGVTTFVFKPEAEINWQPGQYLHYVLPHEGADDRGAERWFTVSSAPYEGTPQITTRLAAEKGSSFKHALDSLAVGASIEADGPEGDFTLGQETPRVFIAGGIGITPFHSMIKEAAHSGSDIEATLIYGSRDQNIVFKQEIDAYAAKNPKFKAHYLIDPERIDETSVRRLVPDLSAPTFFVSGPEPMVKAIAAMLEGMGVAKEKIKLDDFPGYPME